MKTFIFEVMNSSLSYFGIAFLIALENIFPPIPSEVILTFGGFLASYTKLTIWGVILAATVGSIVGALVLYGLGYILNVKRLKKFVNSKLGRVLRLKEDDIDKANDWFGKKGIKTVFFCRFVPVIRSLISIPAGISKMSLKPFLIFTFLGSVIWNTVLVILGYILGDNWESVVDFMSKYTIIAIIILILLLTLGIIILIKKRKNNSVK